MVLLFLGIIIVFLGLFLVVLQSITGEVSWLSWAFILYGIAIIFFYRWKYNSMGKSAHKKLTSFHYPFEFTFSEEKVITKGKHTTSESEWRHYLQAVITDQMILLYPNRHNFIILPKKYFTDEEFLKISSLVREKVKCK